MPEAARTRPHANTLMVLLQFHKELYKMLSDQRQVLEFMASSANGVVSNVPLASRRAISYTPRHPTRAQVAQLVEQRIENPRVAGSIPALGTTLTY